MGKNVRDKRHGAAWVSYHVGLPAACVGLALIAYYPRFLLDTPPAQITSVLLAIVVVAVLQFLFIKRTAQRRTQDDALAIATLFSGPLIALLLLIVFWGALVHY